QPNSQMISAMEYFESYKNVVPSRFPTFCAGCPERATLYTILKATNQLENTVVCGDIGCFVMSFFPPQQCSDLIICMSGGLSAAIGMSTKTDQKVIAFIGDSTFLHTGMAPLAEAAYYNSNVLLFIFENSWTAMTGHQPVLGLTEKRLSIEKICRAVGVPWLRIEDSYNPKKLIRTIEEALETKGFKVIIVKRECAAIRRVKTGEIEEMQIDEDRCIKCGVCYEVCPNGAIRKSIINLFGVEVPFREL
ncbi:MAG: thiamine pyrophosphate-dependent enzyme, partial [Promethearchaeota archaeon]